MELSSLCWGKPLKSWLLMPYRMKPSNFRSLSSKQGSWQWDVWPRFNQSTPQPAFAPSSAVAVAARKTKLPVLTELSPFVPLAACKKHLATVVDNTLMGNASAHNNTRCLICTSTKKGEKIACGVCSRVFHVACLPAGVEAPLACVICVRDLAL